jgi:CRP/FNR family transcriptional regulator
MPSDLPARCAACAARNTSLCSGLGDDALAALHALARRRTLRAGQALSWTGDPAVTCGNLVSGVLKITRAGLDKRSQIVGLLYPGDFAGELFVTQTSDTIAALTDADLCVYPREVLERTLACYPAAERLLLQRALASLSEARRWLPMLARARAEARIAALLVDIARRCGEPGNGVVMLPLSRGAMGEVLGLAIETVSRNMSAFQDAGLISLVGLRGVRLLDRPALARLAG